MTKENHTEIDIYNILDIFFKERLKIIFIFLIAFILATIFNYNSLESRTIKYFIDEQPITELYKYGLFNELAIDYEIAPITEESLLNDAINEISSFNSIIKSIKSENIFKIENFESASQYKNEIEKYSSKFNLLQDQKQNDKNSFYLHYQDAVNKNDDIEMEQIFKSIILNTNETVRLNIIDRIESKIKNKNDNNKTKIEELEQIIENIKLKQYYISEKKLNFLREQSELAKILNIETPVSNESMTSISIINGTEAEFPDKYYLNGYVLINKQIEIIKKRDYENNIYLVDDLVDTTKELNKLKNSQMEKKLRESLIGTPIMNQNEFEAILLNTNLFYQESYSNNYFKNYLIFLAIGIFFTFIYIFFRHFYISQKIN
tara:strand:- start:1806 stop:2933 length:1128 start_codon:yes stop_codon:yes gene_type:complete